MASSTGIRRIALVSERYPPDSGGLAASVGRLARGLVGRCERVEVFTLTSSIAPGSMRLDEVDGVAIHHLGQHRKVEDTLADWIAHLSAQHRRDPFHVIHAYYVTRPSFVAVFAARLLGVPSVVSARGNDLDRTVLDPSKAAHTLYALQHATAVTANSRDLARKAEALGVGRGVTLIPNGVDAEHFHPQEPSAELRNSLGFSDRPIIGFVGEARAKKGLAHLLLAYGAIAERTNAALLFLGGVRKNDRSTLDVFRAQHPSLPIVVVEDVSPTQLPPYYALIDVLTMPSLRDGLPNALLEGMACGRAVVATDAGGMPDVLRHGENAHMIEAGDVEGLAAGMSQLVLDHALRSRYGSAARATVLERFTLAREIDLTLELYEGLHGVRA